MFKPGDKVRCINNLDVPSIQQDAVYTVEYSRTFEVFPNDHQEYIWLRETGGWILANVYVVKVEA